MIYKNLSPKEFKKLFFKDLPQSFNWQKTPVQVYPLSFISKYIITPTPLLQPNYNFLIYIQEGEIIEQIGAEVVVINGPAILFMTASSIHAVKKISNQIKGYIILLENKTLFSITNKDVNLNFFIINPVIKLDKAETLWTTHICHLLHNELSREKPNRNIGVGLLQALLYKVLELSQSSKPLSRNQMIAVEYKQLVSKFYKDEKKVNFYAQKLSISENYLNRCTRSIFQKSSKKIIIETAILNSQILMWNTSKDISEICFELNFDDPSYFSRVFKKVTGQTPTEYRNEIMHDLS